MLSVCVCVCMCGASYILPVFRECNLDTVCFQKPYVVLDWHPVPWNEYKSPHTSRETRPIPHALSPDLKLQGRLDLLLPDQQ